MWSAKWNQKTVRTPPVFQNILEKQVEDQRTVFWLRTNVYVIPTRGLIRIISLVFCSTFSSTRFTCSPIKVNS